MHITRELAVALYHAITTMDSELIEALAQASINSAREVHHDLVKDRDPEEVNFECPFDAGDIRRLAHAFTDDCLKEFNAALLERICELKFTLTTKASIEVTSVAEFE